MLSATCFKVVTGSVMAVFPPRCPPVVPNSENVFEAAVATSADYIVTVPPFVEVSASIDRFLRLTFH